MKLILETQMNSGLPLVPEESWEIGHMIGVMPRVSRQLWALVGQGAITDAVAELCITVYQDRLEHGQLVSTLVSDGTQSWRFKLVLPVHSDAPRMTLVWNIDGRAKATRLRMYADSSGFETELTSAQTDGGTRTHFPLTVTGPLPELAAWLNTANHGDQAETIRLLGSLRLAY